MSAPIAVDVLDALVADVKRRAALVTFARGSHRYTVGGQVKVSCTGAIDGAGFRDTRFMQDRTERGRYVHEQTLPYEDGLLDMDSVEPEHRGYVESFAGWFDMVRPVTLLREQIVYDPDIDVTGTVDRLWLIDGELEVTDFKAGVAQAWHAVQTAGYKRLALAAAFADLPARRSSLLLRKDGKPAKRLPHDNDHDDSAAFLAAVSCHHWRDRHVRP